MFVPTYGNWSIVSGKGTENIWGVYMFPAACSVELRLCGSPFLRDDLKSAVTSLQGLDKDSHPGDFCCVTSDYSLERLRISPTLSESGKNIVISSGPA